MKRFEGFLGGLLLLVAAGTVSGQKSGSFAFPGESELRGWRPSGEPLVYAGESLFDYIDGGAELVLEFGFRSVMTQDYIHDSGRKIVLERYEMEDEAAAFGLFTVYQTPDSRELALGDSSFEAGYFVGVWKGRDLLLATADAESPETRDGLRLIASAAAERLSGKGTLPDLIGLLPETNRLSGGLDYFEGPLGFRNSLNVLAADLFPCRRGVKAVYAGGIELFLLEYDSPNESRKRFFKARESYEG